MPHIFISYAKKDTRALAETLVTALTALPGISAWMDTSLEADDSWAHQIQREIDHADYVIVLLSDDVNRPVTPNRRRSFVLNEIDYAQGENKPILPVMVQATKVPVQIAGIQYIDLTATPNDPTKVIERVCQRFGIPYTSVPIPGQAAVNVILPMSSASGVSRVLRGRSGLTFGAITVLIIAIAVALSVSRNTPHVPDVTQTSTEVAQIAPSATVTLTPSLSPTPTSQPTETVVPTHTPSPTESSTATERSTDTPRPSSTSQATNTLGVTPAPATLTFTPVPTADPCMGRVSNTAGSSAIYYQQARRTAESTIRNGTTVRVVENIEYKYDPSTRRRYYKIEFGSQSGFIFIDYVLDVDRDCPYYEEP